MLFNAMKATGCSYLHLSTSPFVSFSLRFISYLRCTNILQLKPCSKLPTSCLCSVMPATFTKQEILLIWGDLSRLTINARLTQLTSDSY
uniref:Ovule protein n=1 Tax=Ascaris lumbricoides TaxID=6252 RepID=A0A0M3HP25_ASCLU